MLILIGLVWVRLGLETVPDEYFEPVKKLFNIPQWVGIMGGKKNKALYFVGHEGDSLIFLDPHYVTDAIKKENITNFDVSSYIWKTPKKLAMNYLDPWLGVGFLVKDSHDFEDLKKQLKQLKKQDPSHNIISLISQ